MSAGARNSVPAATTDLTQLLNELNLGLQGKEILNTQFADRIAAFKEKLLLWIRQMQKGEIYHFPSLSKRIEFWTMKISKCTHVFYPVY